MKKLFQIIYMLSMLLFAIPMAVMGADWEKQRDQLLRQAEEEYNKALQEKAGPEKIARDNGLEWPIKPPAKHKLIIRSDLLNEAQKLAEDEFSQEFENREIAKIREQYSLFKLEEVITVETKLRQADLVTGKLSFFNREYAKVGNRIINLSDMPDHVRDRFFQGTCIKLQERKIKDLKRKIKVQKATFIEDKCRELLPDKLKENGYYPLNDDESSREYTSLDNWVSQQDLFEKKLAEAQDEVKEELHDEIVGRTMKDNGFVYNAIQGAWIPSEQTKTQGKKGTFQKLKGIFGD
ncbi:MAG: hypothetical protein IJS15_15800 [Victivallales bacterium]|nr:hypothetical protein [Victivallales bacterium]